MTSASDPGGESAAVALSSQVREALDSADLEAFAHLLAPDVHWGPPGGSQDECVDRRQVLAWYRRGRDRGTRARVTEVIAGDDVILVGLAVSGRDPDWPQSGEEDRWQVLRVADGLVVDIRGYDDREQARQAAGLPAERAAPAGHAAEVHRYTAFTLVPSGGNPAGVVLDAGDLSDEAMLAIAAEVGYSETAFLWPLDGPGEYRIRYFSPVAEVPFCGHATIASGVALADHGAGGEIRFHTLSGIVPVRVETGSDGHPLATLTSVTPQVGRAGEDVVGEALASFGWAAADLDPQLPPRTAFAGAHHLVFGLRTRELLSAMTYDFERLRALMERQGWTTVQVVWREQPHLFHARVPFPVGGVVEDPATGAAAAALGAYLRALGLVDPPARITIRQGDDLGRPSLIRVAIDPGEGGIHVSGNAVLMEG